MNHIEQTIDALNQRIGNLTLVRDALVKILPELIFLPATAPAQPAPAARRATRVAGAKGAPKATPKKRGPYKPRAGKVTSPQSGEGEAARPTKAPAPAAAPLASAGSAPAPATFAGALKRVVREAGKPLTVSEVFKAIESRWPALAEGKDGGNVMANLSYAAAQGHCEKLRRGEMATFRILKADYFDESEQPA